MLLHHSCLQQRNLLLTRLTAFAFEVWRSSARLLAITHALPCLHSLQRNPFVCGFVRDCAFGNICAGDTEGDSTVTKRIRLQKRRLRHCTRAALPTHISALNQASCRQVRFFKRSATQQNWHTPLCNATKVQQAT
jgi:hypothetical protein